MWEVVKGLCIGMKPLSQIGSGQSPYSKMGPITGIKGKRLDKVILLLLMMHSVFFLTMGLK